MHRLDCPLQPLSFFRWFPASCSSLPTLSFLSRSAGLAVRGWSAISSCRPTTRTRSLPSCMHRGHLAAVSPRPTSRCWLASSCSPCYDVPVPKRDRNQHCKAQGRNCGPVNLGAKARLSLNKEEKLDPRVEGRGLLH